MGASIYDGAFTQEQSVESVAPMKNQSTLLRQWNLLRLLSGRHYGVTVAELADEMNVCPKTIARDLARFRDVGFPIKEDVLDRGLKRWKLLSRSGQPPLSFAYDEAMALFVGRRFLEPLAGTMLWRACQSAFSKIHASLGEEALHYVETLASRFHSTVIGASDYSKKADLIDSLMIATEDCRQTIIVYRSARATEPVEYQVQPYGIAYHRGSLYLVAVSSIMAKSGTSSLIASKRSR